jgi:hypothetical protein
MSQALDAYLTRIGATALLTAAEEVALQIAGRTIHARAGVRVHVSACPGRTALT